MELVHLIYTSAAKQKDLSPEELETILHSSRVNNEKADITGILLFQDGCFFQVLEGDRQTIEPLYRKISFDRRHTNCMKLIIEPIEERCFGQWSMGYPKITKQQLSEIEGLNDFFTRGKSFSELEEGRARQLLAAFKDGKWRNNL